MVLSMDNGPEIISQALQQFCDGKVGLILHRAGENLGCAAAPQSSGTNAR